MKEEETRSCFPTLPLAAGRDRRRQQRSTGWGRSQRGPGYEGRTALHCAAKAGFVRVAEALIEYGADVNALDDFGRTPLDAVEEAGKSIDREPMRRLLIAHAARHSKQEAM